MLTTIETSSLLAEIYRSTHDHAIFTTDLDGRITTWNMGAERITGFLPVEVIGQSITIIFTPEDRARGAPGQEMLIARTTGRAEDYRWHLRKDGSRFWADGVLTSIHDEHGQRTGYLKIFRDITDRKLAEAELNRVANSDMLTGLANRYAFDIHMEEMIVSAKRSEQSLALHLIDLDGFKQVNDGFGHHVGDLLLKQVAERMKSAFRDCDFLARLGGDEFVVLQPNMPSLHAGVDFAQRMSTELARPFAIDGHALQISGSIGIALCPQDATDGDLLLKRADLALYRAKTDGRGNFRYFTEKLDAQAHKRNRDVAALRYAVAHQEFWLAYQPQISFATGKMVGMEVLLRSSNPVIAGYSMESVVDLAVQEGLMKQLSYWVLRQACGQFRQWKWPAVKLCINLCSQDLTDAETPSYIDSVMLETGLQCSDLEIELTERQALEVEQKGIPILQQLRDRGIRITLDDFGTGYSALGYLRNLPITAVKLDKSFLVGIPHSKQACAVVKAVIDMSLALDLEVIAEGVETSDQFGYLDAHGCHVLQGFLVSKPLSAHDMSLWLATENTHVQESWRARSDIRGVAAGMHERTPHS